MMALLCNAYCGSDKRTVCTVCAIPPSDAGRIIGGPAVTPPFEQRYLFSVSSRLPGVSEIQNFLKKRKNIENRRNNIKNQFEKGNKNRLLH